MISIVTTCVNYLDFLKTTYEYNQEIFRRNNYWIITDNKDQATQQFCKKAGINVYCTDTFYQEGSNFNKSSAINELFRNKYDQILENEWILLCDADVIIYPAVDYFCSNLGSMNKKCLYSIGRKICYNQKDFSSKKTSFEECKFLGFFQLFHRDHIIERLNNHGWFVHSYHNASTYDLEFAKEFECKHELKKLHALHLGPTYTNWDGRKSDVW